MTPDERAKLEEDVVQHNEMRTDLTAPASEFDTLPASCSFTYYIPHLFLQLHSCNYDHRVVNYDHRSGWNSSTNRGSRNYTG